MATSHPSEPPADEVGGSEVSAGGDDPTTDAAGEQLGEHDDAGQPWWSADDDEFAGATPLFDGVRRPHPDAEPPPPPPRPEQVGTPIGEALKLAGAFMQWAEQSGLSDTIRDLAAEASTALSDLAPAGADEGDSQVPPRMHSVPLHRVAGSDEQPPQLVCDYCPLCRGMEVVRTVQPQMSQGMAEAMASLTSALNYAVDGFVRRQRSRGQG